MSSYSEQRGYNLGIAKKYGLEAAVVYNQLAFWQSIKGDGKWFYKPYEEMTRELPLSEYQLRKAYAVLKQAGMVDCKLMKVQETPKIHFRILRNLTLDSEKTSESHSEEIKESLDSEKTSESIYNNKEPIKNLHSNKVELQAIQRVYDHFIDKFGKNPNQYKLSIERKRKLKLRLKDAGEKMLIRAIDNTAASGFHRGDNDRGWEADFDFIIRKYEQVEKLANMGDTGRQLTREELADSLKKIGF